MSITYLSAFTLGLVVLSLHAGCAPNHCGPRPPGFALQAGGFWDEGKSRTPPSSVSAVCDQYRVLAERVDAAKKSFALPSISLGSGALTLELGQIHLSVDERSTYAVIHGLDLVTVQGSIARCQTAMLSYECVVFSDPAHDPRIAGADQLEARVERLESLTAKVKLAAQAKDKTEFDRAGKAIKEELQRPLTGPDGLGELGELERGIAVALGPPFTPAPDTQIRLAVLQGTLESLLRQVDANTSGIQENSRDLQVLSARLSRASLRLQRIEEAASAKAESDRCLQDTKVELARILQLRKGLESALATSGVTVDLRDLHGPVVLHTQQEGFGVCKALLSPGMTARLDSLLAALSAKIPAASYAALRIIVHGYSDELPITTGPGVRSTTDACHAMHKSNIVLAERRAAAVVAHIVSSPEAKKMALNSDKMTSLGHEKEFVVTGCKDEACHAQNRRFRIVIDAPMFRFEEPQACLKQPDGLRLDGGTGVR